MNPQPIDDGVYIPKRPPCGLTKKNISDLERIQKSALRVILKERYIDYKNALNVMKLDTLEIRREKLCLKFATNSKIA